jgi:hypothetical protein
MKFRFSMGDVRTLRTGATLIALLVLLSRGLPAWRDWDNTARGSAADMIAEASRAEAFARTLPMARESLEVRRQRMEQLSPRTLEGGSAASAGATLTAVLSDAASRAGVQLGAVQLRTDSNSAATFFHVSVRADARGDLPSLLSLITTLEGGPELLTIREFSLTQPDPGGLNPQPELLRLELTVEGLGAAPGGPHGATRPVPADGSTESEGSRRTHGGGA